MCLHVLHLELLLPVLWLRLWLWLGPVCWAWPSAWLELLPVLRCCAACIAYGMPALLPMVSAQSLPPAVLPPLRPVLPLSCLAGICSGGL